MKKIIIAFLFLTLISGSIFSQVTRSSETIMLIETNYGKIKIKLYDDTPKHRDNFIKLVGQGFYNGSIFHRVINAFMIQGGGAKNGTEDIGYTIPAEILPKYFHKKGALAAARTADQVNPKKESSGSQFYIVQGKIYTDSELTALESRINKTFTPQERTVYKTIGGTPFLDGAYTVFGEVIEGLDVVDKIAAVKTAPGDKPLQDVTMKISVVK